MGGVRDKVVGAVQGIANVKNPPPPNADIEMQNANNNNNADNNNDKQPEKKGFFKGMFGKK